MAPMSRSQIQSRIRQAQQRRQRAIGEINRTVRKYNSDRNRAIDNYNREVRTYNARARRNRERLARELARSARPSSTTVHIEYRRSVMTLRQSFSVIEGATNSGRWTYGDDIYELAAGEAANSVSVLNALDGQESTDEAEGDQLKISTISGELESISVDLCGRWEGALYALDPRNPDAARHFCSSAREILTRIVEGLASDQDVLAAGEQYPLTPNGKVSRRARIMFSLDQQGRSSVELERFIEADIDNVVALFQEFNEGTHGTAGIFNLMQLKTMKRRVEDAVHFLHLVTS